jgi:replicative DNA helicase
MLKLLESPQFKADYKRYQEEIRKITDEKLQAELVALLMEFTEQIRLIDRYHSELNLSSRIPTGINEARSTLQSCKKKLDNKLSVYKNQLLKNQA